jgi:chromosomal replication initiation ATPase DnaA
MAKLDPRFTFESFVVGPANRLASAAARRAAERPGVSYNPLFIFAAEGLGKTHVLGAIARHVEMVYPDKVVEYQTPDEFLRAFVGASGVKGEAEVQARFADVDILLLDNVQFLTPQKDVQDVLLSTLKALTGEGKQVVLACDRPPADIDGLGAALRTRLEGGLLVAIGAPEYETRVAIVTKWAETRGSPLEPAVADAIGRFPWTTVGELEEALNRILDILGKGDRVLSPEDVTFLLEQGAPKEEEESGSELGQFLDELSGTVADKVQAQEALWRKRLRESAEEAEADGFSGAGLRKRMTEDTAPGNLDGLIKGFQSAVQRLKGIEAGLEAVGNPWPEAAHGVLRDPERLTEAEALLASAQERAKPFPELSPGPTLEELGGDLPKLVLRAADQLVSTDRAEYNPLYVWSADGMAARALLQAAGRSRLAAEEDSKVAMVSVETFAEEFIRSLSAGVAGAWRERWWVADLLLIDGAEVLEGTERAQEELFHLFEALSRRRARIMIAADRPPNRISALDDRLRARLEGGLVVEVEVDQEDLSAELQDTLQEPAPEPVPERVEKKDVSDEDLEWIMSFQPKVPAHGEGAGAANAGDQGEILDSLAAGAGGADAAQEWVPSPEKVVMEWPRVADRIVEEAG